MGKPTDAGSHSPPFEGGVAASARPGWFSCYRASGANRLANGDEAFEFFKPVHHNVDLQEGTVFGGNRVPEMISLSGSKGWANNVADRLKMT